MTIITVAGNESFSGSSNGILGGGSVYTAQASGTAGQTALIQGTNSDPSAAIWTTVATLTVGAANMPDSAVWQASWRFYQVTGAATVTIARGAA